MLLFLLVLVPLVLAWCPDGAAGGARPGWRWRQRPAACSRAAPRQRHPRRGAPQRPGRPRRRRRDRAEPRPRHPRVPEPRRPGSAAWRRASLRRCTSPSTSARRAWRWAAATTRSTSLTRSYEASG